MNEQNLQDLRDLLVREFNEDELISLCHDVGINYADLPGMGPYGKTREIIARMQEQHLTSTLMQRVESLRPEQFRAAGLSDANMDRPLAPPASNAAAALAAEADAIQVGQSGVNINEPALVNPFRNRGDAKSSNGGQRHSALPLRVRLIIFVAIVMLLAVAVLSIVVRPGANGAASPTPAADVTLMPASADMTTTAETLAQATSAPAATPLPVETVVAQSATLSVTDTSPAAAAVRTINDQLINFYMGKATEDEVKASWGSKFTIISSFAYKTLKSRLGADLSKGDTVNSTLRYDKGPTLVSEKNGTATVSTREYWTYTNPANNKKMCDLSDYTYTLVKASDAYQIKDIRSRGVSGKCEQ
ncbi:MAG: hypothetical protein M1434_06715 [Chloroflexi bacterium]|nr:hypothetical protein [Chloroflexota bacterium]MCL5274424.1 hypothetical protein [Chloroflexota bacterium]